jgi:septal ring factor EnvC (AmiA/AmiB activator)
MSMYFEVRRRICTGRPPMSDAEIIEELEDEINEYRNKIVRLETEIGMRKEDYRKLSIEKAELDKENEALTAKVDSLSEELKKLKEDKKILIINSDTLMKGRTNGKHMHQMIDEILSIPANRTVIRIYADSDRVPTMSWEVNGHPYNDD